MADHPLRRPSAEAIGATPPIASGPGSATAALFTDEGRPGHAKTGFVPLSAAVILPGTHIDPAVTTALAARRRSSRREITGSHRSAARLPAPADGTERTASAPPRPIGLPITSSPARFRPPGRRGGGGDRTTA
ncbi:hypothetical protein J2853_001526 [Streptosporangium lutulentum]|uniref:Uncharacterized protein n=1 Tax=Streptosporangium lutulentum TaxID=1461250 RepID=A0ABT9Q7D5_9ACTN|nr:hypothetical protein [Streptosporangium lutulentum]